MDKRAMLDEVIRLTTPPQLREDEFTAYDYMAHCQERGLPKPALNTAHRELRKKVEEGVMSCRRVLLEGRWTIAYSLTGEHERQTDEE